MKENGKNGKSEETRNTGMRIKAVIKIVIIVPVTAFHI